MTGHVSDLAERRLRLQAKAAEQRRQLRAHVNAIDSAFHGVDRGFTALRSFAQKPVLIAAGAALLYLIGRHRALGLATKALLLISTARSLLRLVKT